jgi:hypothetical protein
MNDRDDPYSDRESILMALDQISQTIDVMTSVVGRLRSQVEARGEAHGRAQGEARPRARTEAEPDRDKGSTQGKDRLPTGSSPDRILH